MLKVIVTVGIPASGKSTWAKKQVADEPEKWKRTNRDDLRAMMDCSHWTASNEKMVIRVRDFILVQSLKSEKNVIIDDTNLKRKNFDDICSIVKDMDKDVIVMEKFFDVELDEAIERDSKRTGTSHVGADVVKKMWKDWKNVKTYAPRIETFIRGVKQTPILEVNPSNPWVVLSDLDGTLAGDISHRSPYDASTCEQDTLSEAVAETILAMREKGYHIIFMSGREDKYEAQTRRFIEKHIGGKYDLHMRKSNDFRKDNIIKEELFDQHIRNKYNVLYILDDRKQVVDHWRSMGLKCFQVEPGNF